MDFFKNWGIFLSIILIVIGVLGVVKFKSWQTIIIGAILSLLGIILHLWWSWKKDNEEKIDKLYKKVLKPLNNDLNTLISETRNCEINGVWRWKELKEKEKPLCAILPKKLREDFDNFTQILEKKKYLCERRKLLKELISEAISEVLLSKDFIFPLKAVLSLAGFSEEKINDLINKIEMQEINPDLTEYLLPISSASPFEGTNFFQLIFENITFKQYKERLFQELRNKGINEGEIKKKEIFRVVIDGESISEVNNLINDEIFNTISVSLIEKLKDNKELQEFREGCRVINSEALQLKQDIEDFLKRNGISL